MGRKVTERAEWKFPDEQAEPNGLFFSALTRPVNRSPLGTKQNLLAA